ncbi:hypothetical protein GF402_02775 [Candidatus Fermentibacteria bacterium]|nr:hypothetical protein [Candidatus Fermentibacteria bacterium]
MRSDRLPPLAALAGGFLSVLAQSTLLREALFGQRLAELSTGLVLAGWLAGSGMGAAITSRLRRPRLLWKVSMAVMPFLTLGSVLLLRSGGLLPAIVVLPAGFAAGAVFVQPFESSAVPKIYALEALGAVLGGGAFVLLSPHLLTPELLLVGLFCASTGLLVTGPWWSAAGLAASVLCLATGVPGMLTETLNDISFGEYEDVSSRPSPYGEITTVTLEGERSVYRGGVLSSYSHAPEAVEAETVLPLLLSSPRNVLYAGCDPAVAFALARWPGVDSVVAICEDPDVIRLHPESTPQNLRVVRGDGRAYLARSRRAFDLVLCGQGSPLSLSLNRFYTREFFGEALSSLSEGGLLTLGFHVGQNRVVPVEARQVNSVLLAAEEVFESVRVLPLQGARFVLSPRDELQLDGAALADSLRSMPVELFYLNAGTLPHELSDRRTTTFLGQLRDHPAPPNTDLHPVAFHYASRGWRNRMGEEGSYGISPEVAAAVAGLLLIIGTVRMGKPELALSCGFMGFGEIAAETAVILLVQSTIGYSYVLLGAITGCLMAGLGTGAWLRSTGRFGKLWAVQAAGGLATALIGLLALGYDSGWLGSLTLSGASMAGLLLLGVVAGIQFPLAAEKAMGSRRRAVGLLELADLGGSACGGILLPLVLFPAIGAVYSILLAAVLVVLPVPALLRS